jgi:Ca-activated chloride channel family protein
LVTRLTSLVAVDQTPSRPEGARLTRADVPLNRPAGWEFDKVFGGERVSPVPAERRADGAVPRPLVLAAYAKVVVSNAPKAVATKAILPGGQNGVILPKTATDAELRLWLGLLLGSAGLILLIMIRWRRHAAWEQV